MNHFKFVLVVSRFPGCQKRDGAGNLFRVFQVGSGGGVGDGGCRVVVGRHGPVE